MNTQLVNLEVNAYVLDAFDLILFLSWDTYCNTPSDSFSILSQSVDVPGTVQYENVKQGEVICHSRLGNHSVSQPAYQHGVLTAFSSCI